MKKTSNKTDEELVELAKKNPNYLTPLISRYQEPLFRFVKRISYFTNEDIEDILQEAFIKAYKNLNSFDNSFKFSNWIYQIVRNQTTDTIRKKKVRPQTVQLEDYELLKIFKSSTNLENEAALKDDLGKIKRIIQTLPLKYREVLILRFLEEKKYSEIVDILKKPKGTIATLLNRGRKMLRTEMKKQKIESLY